MSFAARQLSLDLNSEFGSSALFCTAAAAAGQSAAIVPFQRQQPGFPPHKKKHSAVSPAFAADHSAEVLQFVQ